jgi:Flp pilus assembly protein TadD
MSDDADEPADRDRARDGEATRDGRPRADPDDGTATAPENARPPGHEFSGGQGYDDTYEGFDLDPPELSVDPGQVDPVDSRVVADTLDRRQVGAEDVDATELLEVGLSYMRINRHEQAADAFERVARFTDDDRLEQEAWVNKGVAHAELEEYDPAVGAYREALRIDDGNDHAASAETNLAYALYESGRGEQALEHAERAVELDPRFPQAWYNRGFFLLERGLAEDAVEAFDNALRLGFRNAEILDEKARALDEMGEYDRAEEVAAEAEELRERAERELVEEHGGGGAGGAGGGFGDPGGAPGAAREGDVTDAIGDIPETGAGADEERERHRE